MRANKFIEEWLKENTIDNLEDCLIKFAKYHVDKALEAAYENFEFVDGCDTHGVDIKKESILDSYSLTDIK